MTKQKALILSNNYIMELLGRGGSITLSRYVHSSQIKVSHNKVEKVFSFEVDQDTPRNGVAVWVKLYESEPWHGRISTGIIEGGRLLTYHVDGQPGTKWNFWTTVRPEEWGIPE